MYEGKGLEETLKKIKIVMIIRVCLWLVAAAATIYWMHWSFEIYEMGIHEVHSYATLLRPRMYAGLRTSILSIILSLILRRISDELKKRLR